MIFQSRAQSVRRVLWSVLALNLAVTLLKLAVGLASGALAVVADAFHSIVDSSTNVIGLIGVWVAARPADRNHPYGHYKYETITALGIGGMLLVAAFEIGRSVLQRLANGQAVPTITPATIGLMTLTLALNLAVVAYETRAGRRLQSSVLLADATHTRADLLVTLSVIGSLVGMRLGIVWLDPLVAGVVAILLFRAAFNILRSTSEVLTDVAAANPREIERIAEHVPGVTAVSGVRSRGRADAVYVDLRVKVSPAMDTDQAHGVASEVERRISESLPGVVDTVVHVEPETADAADTPWEELSFKLRGLADGLGLGLHDLHAHVEREGGYSVEVHLEMEAGLTLGEAHARADAFERRARALMPAPGLRALVTHLEPLPTELPGEAGRISPARAAELRRRLVTLADGVAGRGTCHEVELHHVKGHLTATLHITQPAEQPLTAAHALADTIERRLLMDEPDLHRIVVHVEPPEPPRSNKIPTSKF